MTDKELAASIMACESPPPARNYTAELQRRVGCPHKWASHFVAYPDVSTLHGALIAAWDVCGREIWVSFRCDLDGDAAFAIGFAGHDEDCVLAATLPAACGAIAKLAIEHVENKDAEEKS